MLKKPEKTLLLFKVRPFHGSWMKSVFCWFILLGNGSYLFFVEKWIAFSDFCVYLKRDDRKSESCVNAMF